MVLILISTTIAGCLPYYYAPNSQNVPLFRQKGESQLQITGSTGSKMIGAELKGAYAAGNHLGLMYNTFLNKGGTTSTDMESNGNLFEGGIGYYTATTLKDIYLETYAGAGKGKIDCTYHSDMLFNSQYGKTTINYSRYFIQPAMGYVSDHFALIFATRIVILDILSITTTGSAPPDQNKLSENKTVSFIEPSGTMRLGGENFKIQFQILSSSENDKFPVTKEGTNFNISLLFSFPVK